MDVHSVGGYLYHTDGDTMKRREGRVHGPWTRPKPTIKAMRDGPCHMGTLYNKYRGTWIARGKLSSTILINYYYFLCWGCYNYLCFLFQYTYVPICESCLYDDGRSTRIMVLSRVDYKQGQNLTPTDEYIIV